LLCSGNQTQKKSDGALRRHSSSGFGFVLANSFFAN
jgi:hypothetical protein